MRRPEPRRHTKPNNQELIIGQIADERRRQIEEEGWTAEHDDAEHSNGELAVAAACYAAPSAVIMQYNYDYSREGHRRLVWPWEPQWWKPKNPRRDLIRAAALIVAEVERLDRAERPQR